MGEDPIGFASGDANFYRYVGNSPVDLIDPLGLMEIPNPNGVVPGGPWTPNPGHNRPGNFLGPKTSGGGRLQCQYVPSEKDGGTRGAKEPYWKVNKQGQKGWQRYNTKGQPINPEQAHPKPPRIPKPPKLPLILWIFSPTPAY